MTQIVVNTERADQPDVEAFMLLSDKIAAELYPESARRPSGDANLASPDVLILLARSSSGSAAGCCALHLKLDNTGELKRMVVNPNFRERGVGKALVAAVCELAEARGLKSIQLEVGVRNVAAYSIYKSAGFETREPFGDHSASLMSHFMERSCRSRS